MIDQLKIEEELNALMEDGEVKHDGAVMYWYYYDDSEDKDILWDTYVTASKIICKEGYDIVDSWQDNDSCGFDIIYD